MLKGLCLLLAFLKLAVICGFRCDWGQFDHRSASLGSCSMGFHVTQTVVGGLNGEDWRQQCRYTKRQNTLSRHCSRKRFAEGSFALTLFFRDSFAARILNKASAAPLFCYSPLLVPIPAIHAAHSNQPSIDFRPACARSVCNQEGSIILFGLFIIQMAFVLNIRRLDLRSRPYTILHSSIGLGLDCLSCTLVLRFCIGRKTGVSLSLNGFEHRKAPTSDPRLLLAFSLQVA